MVQSIASELTVVVTTNTYDALNRVKSTSYSDQITSTANFGYDGAGGNSFGQLTSVSNGNSTTTFSSFDVMGNVLASTQQIGGQTYAFSYGYNLAGALTSETYPSGRVVQTTYDTANRPWSVSGTASSNLQSTTYAPTVIYAAHGGLSTLARGNNIETGYAYNNRLQMSASGTNVAYGSSAYLFSEILNWGTGTNNGNLQSVQVLAGGPAPQSSLPTYTTNFAYDALNRETGVTDAYYQRTLSYDANGNMWVNSATGIAATGPTLNIFSSKNQASTLGYDGSGRVISSGSTSFAYDAENRQTQATDAPGIGGGTVTYAFDAIGERVEKQISGGAATAYVYDAFGKLAAEYSTGQNNSPCTTCYLTWDHLGTPRMVTDQNGNVVARHDYLPFGEEIQAGQAGRGSPWGPQADTVEAKFTGQIRDSETGDDYFNARYYNGSYGRFMSPDPGNAGADITNPQSWNGYAYVGNNPLNSVDPSGACTVAFAGITQSKYPNGAFTSVAQGLGAVEAYSFSGLDTVGSILGVALASLADDETQVALSALQHALSTNAGNVDVLAYSGGAGVFTAAYGLLSYADQKRIGNILYVSPGASGSLAVNNTTSVVRGNGFVDGLAMIGTGVPLGTPTSEAACDHTDFGCLSNTQTAMKAFLAMEANGSCSSQRVFELSLPMPPPLLSGSRGSATSTISYGGGSVNGVGAGYTFGGIYLAPVEVGEPVVTSTIKY